jgi:hypothetical protein
MAANNPIPPAGPVPPPPASIEDRVAEMVRQWAKLNALPKSTDQLAMLWAPQAAPYNPDGAQLLAAAIKREFSGPPVICQCIKVSDLTSTIKTVDDLVTAIPECP